jgi:hypothetical protein
MKRQDWLTLGLIAAGLLYFLSRTQTGQRITETIVETTAKLVRGIRNNNPGNIRLSATTWQGQVPKTEQTDAEFIQFTSPEYGIRAIARVLKNYATKAGLPGVGATGIDTITEMISRWAPPSENDTPAYIAAVSKRVGISPDQHITPDLIPAVIAAIITQENGVQPYSSDVINTGVAMAA